MGPSTAWWMFANDSMHAFDGVAEVVRQDKPDVSRVSAPDRFRRWATRRCPRVIGWLVSGFWERSQNP
ncbi:hypothetical protein SAMN05660733_02722 [Lentzea albidocapillata]|uniref:Uncharacterized protein n=1 Tax=Lentzea albidocapillata TaxID=40571 RepID=A0A1W2D5R0_9PSEU|nr:hypothetical protein SAMN05660733_02722 [Lentzea albidocapillata]